MPMAPAARNGWPSASFACRLTALGLAALALSPAFAGTKEGVEAWESGDYDTAVTEWRGAAEAGDADAAFNLGQAYKVGRGVPQNLETALKWYGDAMKAGHVRASDYYGLLLYQMGRKTEAMPYIRQSAKRGEPRAQYVLGAELFNGTLIEKDWVRAYALMTRASAQGLEPANRVISEMDKHIPLEQRQQGLTIAANLEEQEATARRMQMSQYDLRGPGETVAPVAAPAPARTPMERVEQPQSYPSPRASTPAPAAAAPVATPPSPPAKPTPPPAASAATAAAKRGPSGLPAGYVPSIGPPPAGSVAPVRTAPAPSGTPQRRPVAASPSATTASETEGSWRVQMGAYSSLERAERVWDSYEGKVAALNGMQPYLVRSGGLVKLQYGPFTTRAEAQRSCKNIEAAGGACFPVSK